MNTSILMFPESAKEKGKYLNQQLFFMANKISYNMRVKFVKKTKETSVTYFWDLLLLFGN